MGVYFQLRDLEEGDYDRGYIQLLSNLTEMDKVSKDAFLDQYKMLEDNDNYVIRVIVDKENDKVIASGTLLIEQKFIYNLGTIGHMEDIVVDKDYRQGGHGRQIVLDLVRIGRNRGLYKISLICSDNVKGFYGKCGFEVKAHEMVRSYK